MDSALIFLLLFAAATSETGILGIELGKQMRRGEKCLQGNNVFLTEKAELQDLNDELEAYVDGQEVEDSACNLKMELVELKKALDEEKKAGKRIESELRNMEKTAAKLEEEVSSMRQQLTSTQQQMMEVEFEKNLEASKLREELQKHKSVSEQRQQELEYVTSDRDKCRTQWQQTKETLSKKEAELQEVRVRVETREEENKAVKKHYEAIVAQLTKEMEEAQVSRVTALKRIEVLEVEVLQKLEVYQNSGRIEKELVHVLFEQDESKRETKQLQSELTQVETLLKEKEKEWNAQFEKARQECKERLLQLKDLHQHELEELMEHTEQQQKLFDHFKAFLGHPLVHVTLEDELTEYRRLLDILKEKQSCQLSIRVENKGRYISITNQSKMPHNIGGFILRHKVDGQVYFSKNFSINPEVHIAPIKGGWNTGKSYVTSLLDADGQYQMNEDSDSSSDGAEDNGKEDEEGDLEKP